jgi:hypothetical protein
VGRCEQIGAEPQAGDEADMAADGGDQFHRCEAGVGDDDDDDEPIGQPAPDLENALPGPAHQCLVTPPVGFVVMLRRRQDGEERQGPAPYRPRQRNHHHEGKPAQAAGLDEMAVRGAHRIAVDAARRDFLAPAPFNGVINADDDRPGRQQPSVCHRLPRIESGHLPFDATPAGNATR